MSFHERKKARTAYYLKHVFRHKLITCTACNGSGYYDSGGAHDCGGCDGTGKDRVSPKQYAEHVAEMQRWAALR